MAKVLSCMEQYGTGAIMQNFLKWTRIVEDSNFQIPNHRTSMCGNANFAYNAKAIQQHSKAFVLNSHR